MKNTILFDKVCIALFAALGIAALCGVFFAGAWWHIGTALICFAVAKAAKSEVDEDKEDPYIEEARS